MLAVIMLFLLCLGSINILLGFKVAPFPYCKELLNNSVYVFRILVIRFLNIILLFFPNFLFCYFKADRFARLVVVHDEGRELAGCLWGYSIGI